MYTVQWSPSAEQDLADLWNQARDRTSIADAANEIDRALARNPSEFGESRTGNSRIAFLKPLAVRFDVDDHTRVVRVWDIWRWSR